MVGGCVRWLLVRLWNWYDETRGKRKSVSFSLQIHKLLVFSPDIFRLCLCSSPLTKRRRRRYQTPSARQRECTMAHTISHKRPVDWKNAAPVFFSCFLTWQSNSWVPLKGHVVSILEGRCNKEGEKRRGGEDTDIGTLLYWFQRKLESWEVCKRSDREQRSRREKVLFQLFSTHCRCSCCKKKKQQPKTIFDHSLLHRCYVYWSAHLQNIFRCFWKQTANPVSPAGLAAVQPQCRSCCSQACMQLCCSPAGDKETSPIHHSRGCCSSCPIVGSFMVWNVPSELKNSDMLVHICVLQGVTSPGHFPAF